MEKTMQDMSTGNQPDGFAYEYYSSFEMGEFYFKKIIPSPLVVEEPGLSRWPWTLEHAGSNPAYQTNCPLGFKVKHDTFNIGKKEHYLQGVQKLHTQPYNLSVKSCCKIK